MRLFLFLSVLSISILFEVVNGADELTFSSLVDKVCAKADEKAINLKPKLSFVRSISINTDKIRTRLTALVTKFVDEKRINEILDKVPANTTAMDVNNAQRFLRTEFNRFKKKQSEKVDIIDRIWSEVTIKPPKRDWMFSCWFREWLQDPTDEMHMNRVKNNTKFMSSEYENLFKKFNNELIEAEKIKSNIDTFIGLAKTSFDKLFKSAKPEEVINDVKPLMNRIYNNERELIKKLEAIECAVKEYNARRMIWVDFLVDLRATLTSPRRSGLFVVTSLLGDLCKGSKNKKLE
ncbi:uncharacterized protein LOC116351170 [Contarinia nasturtii]|uniref:uncharacterized protein LOC116350520 n=1 Tax=Contarinia nasturtii TaxID=265458 RepID=UPI0012D49BED|nr:uncharacterized protein LOC116350520 [Contarinia nasturtii]XP_031639113.1 uncharacterized protein LOC116351170 [Contarinia nasturtii]